MNLLNICIHQYLVDLFHYPDVVLLCYLCRFHFVFGVVSVDCGYLYYYFVRRFGFCYFDVHFYRYYCIYFRYCCCYNYLNFCFFCRVIWSDMVNANCFLNCYGYCKLIGYSYYYGDSYCCDFGYLNGYGYYFFYYYYFYYSFAICCGYYCRICSEIYCWYKIGYYYIIDFYYMTCSTICYYCCMTCYFWLLGYLLLLLDVLLL